VSTGRSGIHVCGTDCSITGSFIGLSLNFLITAYRCFGKIFYVDTNFRGFSDFHTFLRSIFWRNQKILDSFVVNLKHRDSDLMLDCVIWFRFLQIDTLEDFLTSSWHNTQVTRISCNRITLSRTSLTICKHTNVVSFKRIVKQRNTEIVEDFILICVGTSRIGS
jgi:hypothetical protein